MEVKELISKTALDKNSEELGKIIRIDKLPHKLTKKNIPYLIIQYKVRFRKKISIPIEYTKVTKVKGNKVWIDVAYNEFLEEVERQKKIILEREQCQDFVSIHSKWFVTGVNYERRPRRRKE